jgi:ApbE family
MTKISNKLKWILGSAGFVLVIVLVLILKFNFKSSPTSDLVGRDYNRQILGTEYIIYQVGDSSDFTLGIDSIEAIYKKHLDLSNPNSSVMQYNLMESDSAVVRLSDTEGLLFRICNVVNKMNQETRGFWDCATVPAKAAWMPYIISFKAGTPNLDSLREISSLISNNLIFNKTNDGFIEIKKNRKNQELELLKIGRAMFLDDVMQYLQKRMKGKGQIVIRTNDNWVSAKGTQIDSLMKVNLWTDGNTSENNIILNNRAFASCNSKEKKGLINPMLLAPPENEMFQTYVSAPTLLESVVYAEAFMIMGVSQMSSWYEANENSDVQSLVYFVNQNGDRNFANTENFGKMMIQQKK